MYNIPISKLIPIILISFNPSLKYVTVCFLKMDLWGTDRKLVTALKCVRSLHICLICICIWLFQEYNFYTDIWHRNICKFILLHLRNAQWRSFIEVMVLLSNTDPLIYLIYRISYWFEKGNATSNNVRKLPLFEFLKQFEQITIYFHQYSQSVFYPFWQQWFALLKWL